MEDLNLSLDRLLNQDEEKKVDWETLERQIQCFNQLLEKAGLSPKISHSHPSLERFLQLDVEPRQSLVRHFGDYVDLLKTAQVNDVPLEDNRKLAWAAMRIMGLRPLGDVFDRIGDQDIVEFYDQNHVQIFRSLRFFELCSYTVLDVLVNDWPSLYEREDWITQRIFEQALKSLERSGQTKDYENIPSHILAERFSPERLKFSIEMRFHSPLMPMKASRHESPVALISCLRATRLARAS